jgi:hypothetical protein
LSQLTRRKPGQAETVKKGILPRKKTLVLITVAFAFIAGTAVETLNVIRPWCAPPLVAEAAHRIGLPHHTSLVVENYSNPIATKKLFDI